MNPSSLREASSNENTTFFTTSIHSSSSLSTNITMMSTADSGDNTSRDSVGDFMDSKLLVKNSKISAGPSQSLSVAQNARFYAKGKENVIVERPSTVINQRYNMPIDTDKLAFSKNER